MAHVPRQTFARIAAAVFVAVVAGAWVGTAWLSRSVDRRAIAWTSVAFAACLAATYVGGWLVAIAWSRDRRTMAFRSVGTSMILVIVVFILEMGAFVGLVNYDLVFRQLTGEGLGPTTHFVEDLEFGYRRPPDMYWSGRPRSDMADLWNLPMRPPHPLTFTTDANGFRNARTRDSVDVVLIGDSYVEGHYVSDDETVAVALEALTGLTVANLGQSGYGSLQELKVLEKYGLSLKPTTVAWFFFEGNDLYDDEEFENMSLYLEEYGTFETVVPKSARGRSWGDRWEAFEKASFTRHGFRQLRRAVHRAIPNGVSTFGWFKGDDGRRQRLYFYDYATLQLTEFEYGRLTKTEKTLREAQRACKARGASLTVYFVPMKFRVYGDLCTYPTRSPCLEWTPWTLVDRVAEVCSEAGIDFVDLTEPMAKAAASGRLLYAPEDSHWNAVGHRFVAEILRSQILRLQTKLGTDG